MGEDSVWAEWGTDRRRAEDYLQSHRRNANADDILREEDSVWAEWDVRRRAKVQSLWRSRPKSRDSNADDHFQDADRRRYLLPEERTNQSHPYTVSVPSDLAECGCQSECCRGVHTLSWVYCNGTCFCNEDETSEQPLISQGFYSGSCLGEATTQMTLMSDTADTAADVVI